MDPTVTGAIIGVGGACVGAVITAGVSVVVKNRDYARHDEQARRVVRQLYRNAFMALNGAMWLGYIDEPGRFQQVMQLLIDRVSKDDIATAFPKHAAIIISSIPELLDGLHGCTRTMQELTADQFGHHPTRREEYADRLRESAGAALAMCGYVMTEIGDGEYFNKNLSAVNAVRVLQFIEDEKAHQAVERERDSAEVEAYREKIAKRLREKDPRGENA
jgi:hypothetical protein